MRIVVGQGSCGIAAGAAKVYSALKDSLRNSDITLSSVGCIGMCYLEPIVDIYEGDELIKRLVKVSPEDAEAIANAALNNDFSCVENLVITADDENFLCVCWCDSAWL